MDICEIKRIIASNKSDLAPLMMRLGWPKEKEARIDVVERLAIDGSEDEGYGDFGATGVPMEVAGWNRSLAECGKVEWNSAVDMDVEMGEAVSEIHSR